MFKQKGVKRFIWVLLGLGLFTNVVNAREISHELSLSEPNKPARIEVELITGSIEVSGYKGDKVLITGSVKDDWKSDRQHRVAERVNEHDKNRSKPSVEGLKKIENNALNLEIEESDNRVQIESHNARKHIELKLQVPFNSSLELSLARGERIIVSNVLGEIEIEAATVPIIATGVKGPIVAEAASSDIRVVFDSFSIDKPSSLTVHSGNIDVTLPKKASAEIEVNSYEGELYSGLDVNFESVDRIEKGDSSKKQQIILGGAMSAKLNGGKQKLLVNTYRGDVIVRGEK